VFQRSLDIGRGDECNVSRLAMGVHTGTHMDAPVHFRDEGVSLDQMPLTATIGEARVIEITDPRHVTAVELRGHRLRAGERILFGTANSARCWQAAAREAAGQRRRADPRHPPAAPHVRARR
jgi:arylformamidase